MKVVEQYKCEICGAIHNTAALAEKCEATHAKILKSEFLWSAGKAAPDSVRITVEGKEGKKSTKTYELRYWKYY
jgi:hypothetical protein